jgi:hypothetical protein
VGKQKGLGNKPSPNYYQSTVMELLHKTMLRRVTICEEESPYKPDIFHLRSKKALALTFALKELQTKTNSYFILR